MRIESSEKEKLDAARGHVRELFAGLPGLDEEYWNKAEIAYWPFYPFEEVLAVFGDRFRTESSLLAACTHVAGLITDGSVSGFSAPDPEERDQILAKYERRRRPAHVDKVAIELPRPRSGEERRWYMVSTSKTRRWLTRW
jgi:hypothetical protein